MFALGLFELLVPLALLGGTGIGLPISLPPLPPDVAVQSAAPEACLYYLGISGTAPAKADSANRTEQLLAQPAVQQFVAKLTEQIQAALASAAKQQPRMEEPMEIFPSLLKTFVTKPAAIYLADVAIADNVPKVRAGLVVNLGPDAPQTVATIAKLEDFLSRQLPDEAKIESKTVAGVALKQLTPDPSGPTLLWGFKDSIFILALGEEEAEALIGRLNKAAGPPAWLQEIHKQLPVERPATVSFFNLAKVWEIVTPLMDDPQAKKVFEALGLTQLTSISSTSGLDANGVVSRLLVACKDQPTGLLALAPRQPIVADALKFVPRDALIAGLVRWNLLDVYQQGLEMLGTIHPEGRTLFERRVAETEQQFGLKLVDDFLKPLGDTWTVYSSAEAGAAWLGIVASVTLNDQPKFTDTHAQVLALVRGLAEQGGVDDFKIVESEASGTTIHTLQLKLPIPVAPSWAITKGRLVVTLNPQVIRDILERDADSESLAEVDVVKTAVASGVSTLSYQDTPAVLGQVYGLVQLYAPVANAGLAQQGIDFELPTLPPLAKVRRYLTPSVSVLRPTERGFLLESKGTFPANLDLGAVLPIGVGLTLPALTVARSSSNQVAGMNGLRQITLAMVSYESDKQRFPAPAIYDPQGKPLLSWRVQLLPYLEEQELYNAFHLEEPWDSPHNRTLVDRMPAIYMTPGDVELLKAGKTRYLLPTGTTALFRDHEGPTIFSDVARYNGTAGTILVVEAAPDQAVVWTRPDDFTVDPKGQYFGLKRGKGAGFSAAFADGSVRLLRWDMDHDTLGILLQPRSDGELDPTKF